MLCVARKTFLIEFQDKIYVKKMVIFCGFGSLVNGW